MKMNSFLGTISWSWVEDGVYYCYNGFIHNNSKYDFKTLHYFVHVGECKFVGTSGNPKKKLSKLVL